MTHFEMFPAYSFQKGQHGVCHEVAHDRVDERRQQEQDSKAPKPRNRQRIAL